MKKKMKKNELKMKKVISKEFFFEKAKNIFCRKKGENCIESEVFLVGGKLAKERQLFFEI